MSRDFQIAWPCNHLILEEEVTFPSDRRSLQTKMPVANTTLVSVFADSVQIPPVGLYSNAKLKSFAAGPYTIVENEQTLSIITSKGVISVTLSIGTQSSDRIAQQINQVQRNLASVSEGKLVLTDGSLQGARSEVQVLGTAISALHFKQTGAQGAMIYPPWVLYSPPTELTSRYPRFTQPLRNQPLLEVSYVTSLQRCLRCQASGIENDFRFSQEAVGKLPAGSIITVQNEDLLYQSCLKMLLTQRGSNPYHPEYGTTILSKIGSKATLGVAASISSEVKRALTSLQTMQRQQGKVQALTFKEQLYEILSVQTYPDPNDPTVFYVEVVVQNASSDPINLQIVYATKGVHSTVNGISLG